MLVFGAMVPHPPILLPTVGSAEDRKKVQKTLDALEKLAEEFAKADPELIIISSPHPDWGIEVPWHFLSQKSKVKSQKLEFRIQNYQEADRATVQLTKYRAVYPILTNFSPPTSHFEYGKKIAAQIPKETPTAWVASGDLSHRLKKDGPYGLHPSGPKFDKTLVDLIKNKDVEGILNLDPKLTEEAGECGLRSICMLLGALSDVDYQPKILSYEGPFGVGYVVVDMHARRHSEAQ